MSSTGQLHVQISTFRRYQQYFCGAQEELEDMGRSERRAVESYLTIVLLHLLKWHVQPALRSKSWRRSVQ